MKRGQIGIWAIVGLILFLLIVVFFIVARLITPGVIINDQFTPRDYIEKCVKEEVLKSVKIMLPQGGFLIPGNYKLHNDTKIEYLCEVEEFYSVCIDQHPALIGEINSQIDNNITSPIKDCFASLESSLKERNYEVKVSDYDLSVGSVPGFVVVDIPVNFSMSKNDESQSFGPWKVLVPSYIYDLANLAIKIQNSEVSECDFNTIEEMHQFPQISIWRNELGDGTEIYQLTHKTSKEIFNFAIRGCVIRPGI